MPRIAAIALISFFDNTIRQNIVEVNELDTWKDAFKKSEFIKELDFDTVEWIDTLSDSLRTARAEFGDGEMDICVTFFDT